MIRGLGTQQLMLDAVQLRVSTCAPLPMSPPLAPVQRRSQADQTADWTLAVSKNDEFCIQNRGTLYEFCMNFAGANARGGHRESELPPRARDWQRRRVYWRGVLTDGLRAAGQF